jgi:hypothetical protein
MTPSSRRRGKRVARYDGAPSMSGFEPRKVGAGSLSRRPGKASFLSILGWGIALRWEGGELPSTTPQADHSLIGQRT